MATFIIGGLFALIIIGAIIYSVKQSKKGGCAGCGGSCGSGKDCHH